MSPLFSVIIAVNDQNAYLLPFTLDSIVSQNSSSYEIILVDGQRNIHARAAYRDFLPHIARVYSAIDRRAFSMANKGAELASGRYLHFLAPGEFYMTRNAFDFVAQFLELHSYPDLVASGFMLRHSLGPPQAVVGAVELGDLKRGKLPATMQRFWIAKAAFEKAGQFDPRYVIKGGFDLICRLYLRDDISKDFMRRILTDYEYRLPPAKIIFIQLLETLAIIYRHFGIGWPLFSWLIQNHIRFLRWWFKSVKSIFWKASAKQPRA